MLKIKDKIGKIDKLYVYVFCSVVVLYCASRKQDKIERNRCKKSFVMPHPPGYGIKQKSFSISSIDVQLFCVGLCSLLLYCGLHFPFFLFRRHGVVMLFHCGLSLTSSITMELNDLRK